MSLSKSQKKIIDKKYPKNSVAQIAKSIGISSKVVFDYLEEKGIKIKKARSYIKEKETSAWGNFFKRTDLVILSLVFLSILVYINSLWGDFVSDDIAGIPKNPLISNSSYYLKKFDFPTLLNNLVFHISKLDSFGYHFLSVFMHSLAVVLLFFVLKKITKKDFLSFLTCLFFAVHPLHSEAVSWISGRPYIFGTLVFLLSFWFYLKAKEEGRINYIYSILLFALANFCEIKSIVLISIFFLYEISFGSLKKNFKILFLFSLAAIAIFFFFRFGAFKMRVLTENPDYAGGVEVIQPWIQIPTAISSYLELFVWPKNLTLYHEDMEMSNLEFGLRATVFLLFLGTLAYSYKKEKLLFFALGLFILSLTPTLLPIKIAWVVAERYVYFGSIGLCLAFAWLLIKLFGKNEKLLLGVFLFFLLGFSTRTIVRNTDWKTRESLWRSTVKVQPRSSKAWNNMGDIYTGKKEYENALQAFQNAIDIRPLYVDAYHNKGVTYMKMGEYDEAIAKFEEAMAIHVLPETLNTLGVAYFEKGEYQKAQDLFLKMLEMNPNDANAYNSLGIVAMKAKDYEKAREYWQKALEINPYAKGPKDNLLLLETQNTTP